MNSKYYMSRRILVDFFLKLRVCMCVRVHMVFDECCYDPLNRNIWNPFPSSPLHSTIQPHLSQIPIICGVIKLRFRIAISTCQNHFKKREAIKNEFQAIFIETISNSYKFQFNILSHTLKMIYKLVHFLTWNASKHTHTHTHTCKHYTDA